MQNRQKTNTFDIWIGIDWADSKHDVCVYDGTSYENSILINDPVHLQAWAADLESQFPGQSLAVAIENANGGIGEFLKQTDFHLFPINPQSFKQYRKAFRVSSAKNDPSDARLLCEYLHKNVDRCREQASASAPIRKLKALSIARRHAVDERTAVTNRMKDLLKSYYPQALTLSGQDIHRRMACDFLEKWPTFQKIQAADSDAIAKFYRQHNCRKKQVIANRLQLIRQSCPLSDDEALLSVAELKIVALVRQLRALNETIDQFNDAIQETAEQVPRASVFETVPGIADTMRARLTVAFGEAENTCKTALDLQCKTGIAPVTVQSGNTHVVHQRYACNNFERQTFVEFANLSIMHSVWARAFYNMKIAKGADHHVAIRALAFKWQRVLYACWKNNTPYSEAHYVKRLQEKQSPVVKYFDTIDEKANKWLRNLKNALA